MAGTQVELLSVEDPEVLSVIYYQQNPLESTSNNVIYFILNALPPELPRRIHSQLLDH